LPRNAVSGTQQLYDALTDWVEKGICAHEDRHDLHHRSKRTASGVPK